MQNNSDRSYHFLRQPPEQWVAESTRSWMTLGDSHGCKIVRAPRTQPHALSKADAFSSPWTYLSRGEREKRKVVRLINENDRIKTYIEVINNVEIRESIMEAHDLAEVEYYNTLARFNQQSGDVLYSTDAYVIESSLRSFFNRTYP